MLKNCIKFLGVCIAVFLVNCSVHVYEPPQTAIEIHNKLIHMDITIGTKLYPDALIDLYDITVGDVSFSSVMAGTLSSAKTTGRSGTVTVLVGEADMISGTTTLIVKNIDAMSATITQGATNTIVFDENSSSTIFAALGKKLAP